MSEEYITYVPNITGGSVAPNPVNARALFLLSVEVTDEQIILQPIYYYSGEIQSGEV